ncbi:hypothetical protein E0L20_10785 [Enterobacter wuhouensis]|uniref:Uncharacterized protein n=1 Tax=Enterobacter wuhouensis TaxID=2529381 RepID=A0A4R0G685_9ENTR|nr:hypothetical protein E0L20_10785 [Enterobacter wuhouensis]
MPQAFARGKQWRVPHQKTDGETNFTTIIARLVSSLPKSNKEAGMPKRSQINGPHPAGHCL